MNSPNPRLVGLYVATYPGLKAERITCLGCGQVVPPRQKVYRLEKKPFSYGARPEVVGHLCKPCRQALGPARRRRYFAQIEAVEARRRTTVAEEDHDDAE